MTSNKRHLLAAFSLCALPLTSCDAPGFATADDISNVRSDVVGDLSRLSIRIEESDQKIRELEKSVESKDVEIAQLRLEIDSLRETVNYNANAANDNARILSR